VRQAFVKRSFMRRRKTDSFAGRPGHAQCTRFAHWASFRQVYIKKPSRSLYWFFLSFLMLSLKNAVK